MGTMVVMKLENQPAHTSKDIFDRFAPIERGFVRTEIPMRECCPLGNRWHVHRQEGFCVGWMSLRRSFLIFRELISWGRGLQMKYSGYFRIDIHQSVLIPVNANESVLGMIHHVTVGKIEQNQQS